MKLRKRDTNETTTNLIPYSYAVARAGSGCRWSLESMGGPNGMTALHSNGTTFYPTLRLATARVINSGEDSKPLDVFAAADVESGVWYSVKEEETLKMNFRSVRVLFANLTLQQNGEKNASLNILWKRKSAKITSFKSHP